MSKLMSMPGASGAISLNVGTEPKISSGGSSSNGAGRMSSIVTRAC
jgi:hypothetical protein